MKTQEGKMFLLRLSAGMYGETSRLSGDYVFTKRIKYARSRIGSMSVLFEVIYPYKERQKEATRGHLWWKKTYTPEPIIKHKTKWYDETMFEWHYKPDEVIYGCEV